MKNTPVENLETTKPNTQTNSSPLNNPWVVTIGIFAASFCICYITHETTKRGCSFELKYKDFALTSSPCISASTTAIAT